ncbi:outer membrane lipoprotein-sorting protein [Candidatus Atribacteria bacterium 1244-E10-H5-B2]|nr:MAG: outer membrane lipoprotein-sorting protein [Candidatus Atribacteria bacterium 1244-E10-H5-B2]
MISKIVNKIKGGKLKMKRNKVKWSVILLVVSVILFSAIGQGFSQSVSDILRKAESNYKNFNQDFKDIAIVFDAKIYTPEGEMLSEMKLFTKGEKFRSEIVMQIPEAAGMPEGMGSILVVVIFDGQDAWMISPFMGKKKLTNVQAEEQMYYQTGMNWWKSISDKAKYIGIERINNRECYVLEIETGGASLYSRIWVDKNNLFLVQTEGKNDSGQTIRMIFSDFRKIKNNWELPYKTEGFMDEGQMMTILLKSFEINQGLSDDLFDVNKVEVSGPNIQEMMQNLMQQGENN